MAQKQQYVNENRIAAAEQKWLDTYRPQGRVSGKYLYPVPEHVYAAAGGFDKIHRHYLEDKK